MMVQKPCYPLAQKTVFFRDFPAVNWVEDLDVSSFHSGNGQLGHFQLEIMILFNLYFSFVFEFTRKT